MLLRSPNAGGTSTRTQKKIRMRNILLVALAGITLLGCSKEESDNARIVLPGQETPTQCDFRTVVSQEAFVTAPADQLSIQEVALAGDCLNIRFSASGCDGNSWQVKLIDSSVILDSDPAQRSIRLSLRNNELCQAIITREVSFDVSNLRDSGNQVWLNLGEWNESILYTY